MATFTDNRERTWLVSVTVDTIRRVRKALDVDLLAIVTDGELLERLADDPVLLCEVLWVACQPQALARSVAEEDFYAGLAGDAVDQATRVLLEELVAFFPKPRRALLAKALAKLEHLKGMVAKAADQRLESGLAEQAMAKALAELDDEIRRSLDSPPPESGGSAGSSPARSGSTPAP